MQHIRIATIPGDGIGREVVPAAVDLLRFVADSGGNARLEFVEYPWGCDFYVREGRMMPEDALDILRRDDAIFLGAIGDPAKVPDHIALWDLLFAIRRGCAQVLNIRPARYLEGMSSPLREPGGLDMIVVRENSEGEYSQVGGVTGIGPDEMAMQVSVFTRRACERAMERAFALAATRRRHVTSATKSNGIYHSMPFWDRVFREVAARHPGVATRSVHIDALLAGLVRDPGAYDVIVAGNLFGDVLTDLAGALMGSIGVAPAANINIDGTAPSMFEPVHGSAPDIAGQGIANPIGQVWTGVLMLEHLGLRAEADRLFDAVRGAIRDGDVTRDMGGNLSTNEVTARLRARIASAVD